MLVMKRVLPAAQIRDTVKRSRSTGVMLEELQRIIQRAVANVPEWAAASPPSHERTALLLAHHDTAKNSTACLGEEGQFKSHIQLYQDIHTSIQGLEKLCDNVRQLADRIMAVGSDGTRFELPLAPEVVLECVKRNLDLVKQALQDVIVQQEETVGLERTQEAEKKEKEGQLNLIRTEAFQRESLQSASRATRPRASYMQARMHMLRSNERHLMAARDSIVRQLDAFTQHKDYLAQRRAALEKLAQGYGRLEKDLFRLKQSEPETAVTEQMSEVSTARLQL